MSEKLPTHYDNLKVARNSPPEVIRAAYRALVQKYHPDRFDDSAEATRIMKIINEAYAVLSDPERRRAHDEWIAEQEVRSAGAVHGNDRFADSAGARSAHGGLNPGNRHTEIRAAREHAAYDRSPELRSSAYARRESPAGLDIFALALVPFVLCWMLLKAVGAWAVRGLKGLAELAKIAIVATVIVSVLFLLKDKASAPAPTFQAKEPSLQEEVRRLVDEGQRGLPKRLTDEIFLIGVREAQNQVIRNYEIGRVKTSQITGSIVREMREETHANFRSVACQNSELRNLLERGMSIAQVYRMADTKRTILTTVYSVRDC